MSLGLKKNISFEGYIPEENIKKVFKEASILVIPYTNANSNGVSGPMLLGMTEGLPIIASGGGARQEDIIDGHTGLIFESSDIKKLSRLLKKLIAEPDLRKKLGMGAHRHIIEEHGWQRAAGIVKREYKAII